MSISRYANTRNTFITSLRQTEPLATTYTMHLETDIDTDGLCTLSAAPSQPWTKPRAQARRTCWMRTPIPYAAAHVFQNYVVSHRHERHFWPDTRTRCFARAAGLLPEQSSVCRTLFPLDCRCVRACGWCW